MTLQPTYVAVFPDDTTHFLTIDYHLSDISKVRQFLSLGLLNMIRDNFEPCTKDKINIRELHAAQHTKQFFLRAQ